MLSRTSDKTPLPFPFPFFSFPSLRSRAATGTLGRKSCNWSRGLHGDLLQRVGLKDVTVKQEFTVSSREEMGRCTCAFEITVLNVSHAIEINDVLPSRGIRYRYVGGKKRALRVYGAYIRGGFYFALFPRVCDRICVCVCVCLCVYNNLSILPDMEQF